MADGEVTFGALALMEHVNLTILDVDLNMRFYEALGCVQVVGSRTLHYNCGALTQFHLPSPQTDSTVEEGQKWRGEMTLGYATAEGLNAALEQLAKLADSGITVESADGDTTVVGPHGNVFILQLVTGQTDFLAGSFGVRKGAVSPTSVTTSPLGIVGLVLEVKQGSAPKIADFYEQVFRFKVKRLEGACVLSGGRGSQSIVFRESQEPREYAGDHLCLYLEEESFLAIFEACLKLSIIYVNPRFVHLDNCKTVEDAREYNAFRTMKVVDPATGDLLLEQEHEIRSTAHRLCPLTA